MKKKSVIIHVMFWTATSPSCNLLAVKRGRGVLLYLYLQMLCFVIPFEEDDGFALLPVTFLQRSFVSLV